MAPAVDTLRDDRVPCWGMDASASHRFRVRAGQARALRAEDQGHRLVAQRQLVERLVGPRRPGPPSTPPARRALQGGGDAGHQGHGQVLDGPGRHLGHGRGEMGRPVPGKDDAGHPGALGAPQQRPQVVGIGDPVQHQQERHPPPSGGLAQRLERRLLDRPGQGHHPLGGVGPGHRVDPAAGDVVDPHPPARRPAPRSRRGWGRRPCPRPSAATVTGRRLALQQLADGLTAFDLVAAQPGWAPASPGGPRSVRAVATVPPPLRGVRPGAPTARRLRRRRRPSIPCPATGARRWTGPAQRRRASASPRPPAGFGRAHRPLAGPGPRLDDPRPAAPPRCRRCPRPGPGLRAPRPGSPSR